MKWILAWHKASAAWTGFERNTWLSSLLQNMKSPVSLTCGSSCFRPICKLQLRFLAGSWHLVIEGLHQTIAYSRSTIKIFSVVGEFRALQIKLGTGTGTLKEPEYSVDQRPLTGLWSLRAEDGSFYFKCTSNWSYRMWCKYDMAHAHNMRH